MFWWIGITFQVEITQDRRFSNRKGHKQASRQASNLCSFFSWSFGGCSFVLLCAPPISKKSQEWGLSTHLFLEQRSLESYGVFLIDGFVYRLSVGWKVHSISIRSRSSFPIRFLAGPPVPFLWILAESKSDHCLFWAGWLFFFHTCSQPREREWNWGPIPKRLSFQQSPSTERNLECCLIASQTPSCSLRWFAAGVTINI